MEITWVRTRHAIQRLEVSPAPFLENANMPRKKLATTANRERAMSRSMRMSTPDIRVNPASG